MIKKILFILVLSLIGLTSFAQKSQRIAFVDMDYILENIPDYQKAQDQLNKKVQKWQQNLDKIKSEIETMRTDLSNEKALLTEDLIIEKQEDIAIKEMELQKLEELYFSSDGNLFLLRRQLVTPIQDKVYNAAQEIAKVRRYDFVFDKSSNLIMLFSNKQYDISQLVLNSIVKGEKISKLKNNRTARNKTSTQRRINSPVKTQTNPSTNDTITPSGGENEKIINQQKTSTEKISTDIDLKLVKIDEREAKRQVALDRVEKQKLDRAKKREEQKAAIEKKRLERLKKREDAKKKAQENKDKKEGSKNQKEDDTNENNH